MSNSRSTAATSAGSVAATCPEPQTAWVCERARAVAQYVCVCARVHARVYAAV
jgi:hypothetical protein